MATHLHLEERRDGNLRVLVLVDQYGDVLSGLQGVSAQWELDGVIHVTADIVLIDRPNRAVDAEKEDRE